MIKLMKILAKNKRAQLDYIIMEKFQAGIVLNGQEVKSVKQGRISLNGAFVVPKQGELFLIGCNIPPYQPKNVRHWNPERTRKLLLRRHEINKLIGSVSQQGLTIIPLIVYTDQRGLIKIEIALAKSRKKYDKREKIKERIIKKEIARRLKSKYRPVRG